MERVHYQQEQMLDELKDLVDKGLFTEQETKAIMKKRTGFETALVRRVAKKADYLRYAAYEMGLEQLRRKRVARLGIPPGPATLSDYALVRRQLHIFERAVTKFKGDVGIWVQYIEVAKRAGARALVGRITARALQMHPHTPGLFVLAAAHELEHHSPSAARMLLQRGLRLNADSTELWLEYLKMELGFVESLRRRWEVLGIPDPSSAITGKKMEAEAIEEGAAEAEAEFEADEAARARVLEGAIVESVISSAGQAVPRVEMFAGMVDVVRGFPLAGDVRGKVLEHLYWVLGSTLPADPRAVVLHAARHVAPDAAGTALVAGVGAAAREVLAAAGLPGLGAAWTAWAAGVDASMQEYLAAVGGKVACAAAEKVMP